MPTTIEEFNAWIGMASENCNFEFKEAKNNYPVEKTLAYCVAIANEGGGKFLLGITDRLPRQIIGTNAFGNIQEIQSRIVNQLRIRVDIEEFKHERGRVLIFHIPSRPKGVPPALNGAYLMRVGEATYPMSPDQLRKIFDEGKPDWFSEIALSRVNEGDLNALLDLGKYFSLTQQPVPAWKDILERFEHEELIVRVIDEYSITNLGAILFARKLSFFRDLERKAIRVIEYTGRDKTAETRFDITGAFGYAIGFERLIDYIRANLPKNEVIGKALRETVQMYPDIAN